MITMALRSLKKRKLRTFLTVLGVVIGTASIVVMISIGIGINESFKKQIEQMGSLQVITVSKPYNYGRMGGMVVSTGGSSSQNGGKDVEIDAQAIEKFKALEGVEAATPMLEVWDFQLVSGKYVTNATIRGIDPSTMEDMGYTVEEGRLLNAEDKNALVIGGEIINNFYNPRLSWQARYSNSVTVDVFNDKTLLTFDYNYGTNNADKKIKPTNVDVVGKMSAEGENGYTVVMPLKSLEKLIADKEKYEKAQNSGGTTSNPNKRKAGKYDNALVKVDSIDNVKDVQQQIKDMGYEARSLADYLTQMQESTKMLRMGLAAIGAISLIVAAIGIANTMVMSIYERTKEIGVMKVIGATISDIRGLFLTEAAFIGFSGGVVGLILSYGMSKIINIVGASQSFASHIPLWLAAISLVFATFVGIASGYFPAKRATKLNALAAIKNE